MEQNERYKICLVGDCLATGGAEKVQALLSDYFVSMGLQVHHVIVQDKVEYAYSGLLLNLGKLKNSSNGIANKFKRLWSLRTFLKRHEFDFIIDFRVKNKPVQEWIIARFLYDVPTIFTVHSAEPSYYFPKNRWLARSIHKNAYVIITVTVGMRDYLLEEYELKNVRSIHNPLDTKTLLFKRSQVELPDSNFILATGRMNDDIKQFDKLIKAYADSILPSRKIDLIIMGDGSLRAELETLVNGLHLASHVKFVGHQTNPYKFMESCRFLVLSSRSEGFGNVLIETLACGKPVISFDCDFGPSEIINHRENGLLVEDQNLEKLTEAMNLFVTDDVLYQKCKSNAKQSVQRFSIDIIGKQWLDLMKIDVS
ncbi:MAG: glycosyltransferase [Flavobacterium sp.]|nr:glycosyltransferase [Flavobacterium sp.]